MENNLHQGAAKKIFENARVLRKNSTRAEKIFWEQVRDRRFCELKFRRQHPLANFIADFYCHEKRLVVEIDGAVHDIDEQRDYDIGRTYELEELGVRVVRFRNIEVEGNILEVLNKIKKYLITDFFPKEEKGK